MKWAKDLNRHFSREDITNDQQVQEKKKKLKSLMFHLICRERQVKTTVRCHSCLSGWPSSKKQMTTSVGNDTAKLEPLYTVGDNANSAATVENRIEVPQKITHRTTLWWRNPPSGYLSVFIVTLYIVVKML